MNTLLTDKVTGFNTSIEILINLDRVDYFKYCTENTCIVKVQGEVFEIRETFDSIVGLLHN